jgi:N-acetylglucosaminyldiphosphoundecaprenol N-acetyl-beta-D-mannosaminyltransferase
VTGISEHGFAVTGKDRSRRLINILGVGLSPMRFTAAVDLMEQWIAERRGRVICFPGSDMLAACQRNTRLRSALNTADLTATDGMMLVRLCRWLGAAEAERVYGPDVMLELCRRSADRGYRHFFYGGAPGVVATLVSRLQQQFPGLSVVGTCSPPFRPLTETELAEDIRLINDSHADVVWIGLGTPKQEFWMADNRSRLRAPLLLAVGAAFDFHAGSVRQAPRWIRAAGGEWFFRLCTQPRRLWRRYVVQLAQFLGLLALQIARLREFPIPAVSGDRSRRA